MPDNKPEVTYTSREERERIGRQTNAGFARVEKTDYEVEGGIPMSDIGAPLTEEEIRRRVGEGNFEAAKDDNQTGSINS